MNRRGAVSGERRAPRVLHCAMAAVVVGLAPSCLFLAVDEEDEVYESLPARSSSEQSLPPEVPVESGGDAFGVVRTSWTVAGQADPTNCALVGATALELQVVNSAGDPLLAAEARCANFELFVDLAPDRYDFEATLVDENNEPLTVTLVNSVRIVRGEQLTLQLDFGLDDFF